jgi:hypothetical protein
MQQIDTARRAINGVSLAAFIEAVASMMRGAGGRVMERAGHVMFDRGRL